MEAVQKEFETLKQACNQYRDEYERVLKKLRFKEKIMFELETITQQQIEELDTRNEELEQLKKRFSDEDVLKLHEDQLLRMSTQISRMDTLKKA